MEHPVDVSHLRVVPRPDVEYDPEEHDASRREHEHLSEGDRGVDDAVGRGAALALPEDAGVVDDGAVDDGGGQHGEQRHEHHVERHRERLVLHGHAPKMSR